MLGKKNIFLVLRVDPKEQIPQILKEIVWGEFQIIFAKLTKARQFARS